MAAPMHTTANAAILLDHVAPQDAALVTALRKAGALGVQTDGRPNKKQRRQILGLRG